MIERAPGQVTAILRRVTSGDRRAFDEVLPVVYEELRGLAAHYARHERPGHTLSPTALTHEAYLRLRQRTRVQWTSRAHFLAGAAQAMRRILVDHARARRAGKRGGGKDPLGLDGLAVAGRAGASWSELIDLDRALERLARDHPRPARVVELLYFGGLTIPEAGELLEVTPRTIERDWRFGRAWLLRAMRGERP